MSSNRSVATVRWVSIGATASALMLACSGQLDGPSELEMTTAGGSTTTSSAGGATAVGGGAGTTAVAVGGTTAVDEHGVPVPPVVPPVPGEDPSAMGPHRLNDEEYNHTLQDLFADPTLAPSRGWLPGQADGFDNIASQLHMNDATYEKYFDAAATVVDSAFARPDQLAKIVTCTADTNPGCRQDIIQSLGLRTWRRPLAADELTRMLAVYDGAVAAGEDHNGALKITLRTFLSSPQFLYRIEFDPDPTSGLKHAVTPFELASRLSYFLWSSTPDDALLADAGGTALTDPALLSATVTRLLADPKSDRFVRNFSGQWLGIRGVAGHRAFPIQFPAWSPELGASMAEEAYIYFAQFLKTNIPWTEFVRADMNFVDTRLAAFYGMAPPAAAGFSGVTVTDDQRTGFLGLGAFLAGSSFPQRTSPTLRAKRILSDLLCSPPPEPPPDVKAAIDAMQAAAEAQAQTQPSEITDIRAFLEGHRTQPDCQNCHAIFDPYGMALENFDGIGQYRTNYPPNAMFPNGAPIDPTATLRDGTQLNGIASVVAAITADPKLSSCVAKKMFVYGLGRTTIATDQPYLDTVVYNWATGTDLTLQGLVQQLVASEPFQMRRGLVTN